MVQFRHQDNAHWYHETQRSGNAEHLTAAPVHEPDPAHQGHIHLTQDQQTHDKQIQDSDNVTDENIFLLGLAEEIPASLNNSLQHHAPLFAASDAMYRALFPAIVTPDHSSTFSLYDRLSSALTVAQVTGIQRLCSHYAARLTPLPSPDASRESNMRLTQMTQYARQLASQPTLIDRHALQQLVEVGLTQADIIVLSQIIGFVGYQARVVSGISAQAEYPTVMLPGFPRMEDAPAGQLPSVDAQWQGGLPGLVADTALAEHGVAVKTELTLNQLLAQHLPSLPAYSAITAWLHNPLAAIPADWQAWVSLVSARINGSLYCQAQHRHSLQQQAGNASLLAALQLGVAGALATSPKAQLSHPLIYISAELTRAPERFNHQHISPLLALGVSHQQLLGIILSTATAGWVNRLRHSLGQTN